MQTYKLGTYGGFRIFEPADEIIPESRKSLERALKRNNDYLLSHTVPEKPPVRIAGTFIQAHAPDYIGGATLQWNAAQWNSLFREMHSAGIDTVILQASLWNELEEVYYPSRYFSSFRQWDVVPAMLEGAKNSGMSVILGGYGSVVGWSDGLSRETIRRELERQTACLKELLQWRGAFDGLYFTPETAFRPPRGLSRERLLNSLYREYFSRVKELAPEKMLLMSPGSKYRKGMENDFHEFWLSMLDRVPLDVLAPQDSVGCCGCLLEEQPAMWHAWKRAADALGIHLWANTELFERTEFGGPEPFRAAAPERVLTQLENVSPYVEKCVCFEYPFFAREARGAAELRTRIFG